MNERRLRRSLLWRLGAGIIAVHVVLLVALGCYAYLTLQDFHRAQKLDELRRIAAILADRYAGLLEADDEAALQSLVIADRGRGEARLTVIAPSGRVVADSHGDPAAMDDHRYRTEVQAAFEHGSGADARFSQTLQRRLLYYARALPSTSDPPPILRVALPLAGINAELLGVWRTLAVAGLVSLVVISTVIVIIARRLGDTLGQLGDGAARFAQGELGHRIAPPATREMARLAESLNAMAGQLGDRIEQLQRQDVEQRTILQSMSNGVVALDRQQHVLSMNRAARRILGTGDASNGSPVRGALLHAVVREPRLLDFVAEAIRETTARTEELQIGPEGRRVLRVTSAPLTMPSGESAGLVLVVDDVTELRRLESLRSDFAANVSHELRTPITNIKGYVETLLDVGPDDPGSARRFLAVIKENGDRLAAIIEDILALTRIEEPGAGDRLVREPAPARAIVQSVVAQFRPAADAKRIALRCEVDADLTLRVQRQLMEQALGNLVSNAINYSPPDTRITIRGHRSEAAEAVLSVEDQGPGIAPEHVSRLFERFYRVDRSRSRQLGGTGLGLAIVKHVALLHGGRAEVNSTPGTGSTFRIVLPAPESGDPADPG